MKKTTVYLDDDLLAAIKSAAVRRGVSEAEVIRAALRETVGATRPRPRGGLFASGETMSDRVDEFLVGFGER